MTAALVLDIEGTTSPTASVHDTLFGYVRERIPHWVKEHGAGKQILEDGRRHARRPDATDADTAEMMQEWLDANIKCEPLKTLQGLICGEGFRNGELHGEFFPDVAPALLRWRAGGRRIYVYSSGSERNQRDWFTYARNGRLDYLIDGYFDLVTAGSKHTATAYLRISETIRVAPADTLFLTDSPAELDAAASAGWIVLGVARAGEPQEPVPPHDWITTFDDVESHAHPVAAARRPPVTATTEPALATGTTIFTEMTALAIRTGAINPGQGFPDRDGPRQMLDAVRDAISAGHNQYPPLNGIPALREAIAAQRADRYQTCYSAMDEVLVTVGATEAITASVLALARPGDEVVVFEPFYDSYAAAIALAGAVRRPVLLRPDPTGFHFDEAELRAAIRPRTRLLILNSPQNPTGKVFTSEELRTIASLCREHDLLVISDEVYEYLCFDGRSHHTIASIGGMADHTIVVSSAGKTFNATGWKVGWLCGPPALVDKVRNVKQYLTFAAGTPFQHAVAVALRTCTDWIDELRTGLQRSRDLMVDGLTAAGVRVYPSEGTYFLQVDARAFGHDDGTELCRALPVRADVAGVPSAAFFDSLEVGRPLIRFAFCKDHNVIGDAVSRLARFARETRGDLPNDTSERTTT